jgi:hypothetical protein
MSLHLRQQHEPGAYLVILAKNDGLTQDGGSKSDFLAYFTLEVSKNQSNLCICLVSHLYLHKTNVEMKEK